MCSLTHWDYESEILCPVSPQCIPLCPPRPNKDLSERVATSLRHCDTDFFFVSVLKNRSPLNYQCIPIGRASLAVSKICSRTFSLTAAFSSFCHKSQNYVILNCSLSNALSHLRMQLIHQTDIDAIGRISPPLIESDFVCLFIFISLSIVLHLAICSVVP